MVMDHLAAVFPHTFPIWFRVAGRFAFVGFAYLVAEGCRKTSCIEKYIVRLGILAVISEIFYDFCFSREFSFIEDMNTVWTLFIGAVVIYVLTRVKGRALPYVYVLCILMACLFADIDYGVYGVILIVLYYFFEKKRDILICTALVFTVKYRALIYPWSIYTIYYIFSIAACLLPVLYNKKRGRKVKYFFYAFYPLHLLIIGIFRVIGEFL